MIELIVDFLFGPDFESALIAWFGLGPDGYSHCASLLTNGNYLDARSDTVRGVKPGIQERDPAAEVWKRRRRCVLMVTQAEHDAWEANLRAKIGDQYAIPDILGYVLDRDMHRAGTYDCSALVINALQHIKKVPFPLPVPAHQITPDAALLIVATVGFTIHEEEIAA